MLNKRKKRSNFLNSLNIKQIPQYFKKRLFCDGKCSICKSNKKKKTHF